MMNTEDIARVAHQANKAYCEALGDTSQVDWEQAPEWQKSSSHDGVKFLLTNLDAKDDALHNNWLEDKKKDGWKYGEVKDPEKKEHPCFVTFEELPPEQQGKDSLFRAITLALKGQLSPLSDFS